MSVQASCVRVEPARHVVARRPLEPAAVIVARVTVERMDHVGIVVDDLAAATASFGEVERYGNVFRLSYVRGPEGIIVELAERIGSKATS